MNQPDELFLAPPRPQEQPDQPTFDGSEEAMRRLRHPFEAQQTTGPDERRDRDPDPSARRS
jgi:hypothetical protein